MFSGAHVVVYSKNAEADRAFFRDVLGFKWVDEVTAGWSSLCRRPKPHFILRKAMPTNSTSCATT